MATGGAADFVEAFLEATKCDLDSPVTSNYGRKIVEYRDKAQVMADTLDGDTASLVRVRKAAKELHETTLLLQRQERELAAATREVAEYRAARAVDDSESEVGAALLKFSMLISELALLTTGLTRNVHNHLVHPMDVLLKDDFRSKMDLKKSVDKAVKDYETRFGKIERDVRLQNKMSGYTRSALSHSELSEQLSKERTCVQYELCKFLLTVGAIEDKKGPDLLRHFIDFFRSQESYFEDGLRTTKLYREDIEQLSDRLAGLKSKQDEERTRLFGLKEQLESSPSFSHNDPRRRFSSSFKTENGLSLAAVENPVYGCSEDTAIGQSGPSSPFSGFLWKKSAKKLHQQWQKRKCRVQEGNFFLNHSDEAQAPVKLSLLVCDVKPSCEDFRTFDLYCRDRTYHFQAESEADAKRWICALKREIEAAKEQMLRSDVVTEAQRSHSPLLSSDWPDRRRCVAAVRRLPGNDRCADCSSTNDVSWLSTNMGALVCISCSGVHRDLGVHISRMQSLDLDVLSPAEFLIPLSIGNGALNEVYEADARAAKLKPVSASTRSVRKQYIVDKYKTRKYAVELDDANAVLRDAIDTLDMKKLLSAVVGGAEVNSLSADNCVLSRLTESADPMALPLVELLVQNGAGAARVSQILSACVERDHLDQLRLVLRAKAVGAGDRQTSLDIALKLGRTDCAKMLRAAMAGDRATLDRVSVPEELFGQRTRASTRTSTDEGSTTGTESSVASIERHSRNGSTGSQPRVALLPPKRPSSTGNQPPVPPLTAKPKLYHRSTSEYNESREVGLSKSFDEDDLGRRTLPGARRVLPLADGLGSVKLKPTATPPRSRPPLPPPKVAGHGGSSDTELSPPIPAPRSKAPQPTVLAQNGGAKTNIADRRCRALYDCEADNGDELSFKQGDIIVISRQRVSGEDDTWMEGYLIGSPSRKGMFPATFVTFDAAD